MKEKTEQFDFYALGQAIKTARNSRKWSRDKVAERLSITSRYLVDIENEGQHPSLQVLYQLVTLFDISVDEYLFPNEKAEKTTRRRQLDSLLDDMDSRDLTIMTGTAKAIQEAKGED